MPPHSYGGECDNTCNVCGHVRSIIKEHTYSSDCDEECNECSTKRTVDAEHSYTNDCDSDCELCGKTREATHTICYDWKTDYYYHWQECACGENISERSYHTFGENGICTVCGDKDKTSKGLEFNEYATEKYELKSMGTCTDTVVIIPSSYNNIPVTRIAAYTFKNQNNVTKIILPDTIEILKSYAFSYCGITELTIPASVNHNNEFAILNCPNLETVTFEEGYRNLSQKHFWKCPKLKTVNLPSTLGRIETKQFNHPNVTIKYNGTMDKWNSISKDSSWAYDFYGKYMCPTVVCTDGTIKNHVYDVEGNFYNEYQHWTKQCSCGQPDYSTGTQHHNSSSSDCPATGCDGCDYTGTFHNKVNLKIENEYYSHPDDYHYLYSFCDYCKQLVYLNKSSHKMVNEKDATHHWQCCTGCNYKINKEAHHGGTATCTEQAKCEDCGTPYGELHHYSAWWSSDGEKHWHACGVCNAVKKDEAEHTPGTAFDNDNDSHWNKCTVCDAKVNVENHTYVNHRCSDCGKDEFTSSGPIVVPGIGGGGGIVLNPTLNCGHKQYDSGDHTTCAGCGNYRCDGNNHGLCEHCGEYICKKGHTQINYNWASDNSKCTANRVCSKSGKVVETETTIDIEKTVTQERSCTADEIADLTASFVHPIFEKQTQKSVKTAEKADHSLVWKNNETKHWSACKNCDFTELEEDHSFTDDSDIDCNFCGYKRAVAQAFTVKIDGVAQTVSGAEFTLPDSSEKGFIAYYDGANYYDAGSKIAVDKNFEFSTIAIGEVKMLNGASIRLSQKSGIRFETQVDTTKLSALPSTAKVEKGTLITLKELATSDLTLESDYKTVDVKYLADEYRENGTFAGSIVNIQDKNLSKAFVGRGYVTVTVGDITKTIYADYYDNDINNNTRLVGYVAYHYRFNCAEQFDALTESQKELIDKWIGSYIR